MQPISPSSRWQDLPLLVVDHEVEPLKDLFGADSDCALVVPMPERVLLLPVVEKYLWQGRRVPVAIVDPIVLDNPGTEGLREIFAPLEKDGQTVVRCYLLAKRHAPGKVSPAPIDYYMQTRFFEGRPYYAHGLWRLSFERWEKMRRDIEVELAGDTLTLTHGWDIRYPELDEQLAGTNVLAGSGFTIRKRDGPFEVERRVPLTSYETGTTLFLCFTEGGRRTLREELLTEESPEAFQTAEERAQDIRRVAEAKDAAEKAQCQQAMLRRVRQAVAAAPKIPNGKTAGEKRIVKLPGGATMAMVWCPPGSFWMGSPPEEEGRQDEETRHWVTLTRGFWMAETEVTQGQWKSVMGYNPSYHKDKGNNRPVALVSWFEVQEFCLKVGLGMQLPTEAEWEYACRAGGEGPYAGTGNLDEMGWFGKNSETRTFWGERDKNMHPVGQKAPNAWGLRDMHGNAREWCEDVYGAYSNGENTDPAGPDAGEKRVVRNGDFASYAEECRCARRYGFFPESTYFGVGFRPVIVGTLEKRP